MFFFSALYHLPGPLTKQSPEGGAEHVVVISCVEGCLTKSFVVIA